MQPLIIITYSLQVSINNTIIIIITPLADIGQAPDQGLGRVGVGRVGRVYDDVEAAPGDEAAELGQLLEAAAERSQQHGRDGDPAAVLVVVAVLVRALVYENVGTVSSLKRKLALVSESEFA